MWSAVVYLHLKFKTSRITWLLKREISQYQVHLKKICANLYPATNIKIHHILWWNNEMMLQTYVHGISIEHRFVQIATHAIRDSWTKNQISWPGQLPAILSQLIFVLGSLRAIIHSLIKPSFLHRPSTKLYERNLIRDRRTIWSGTYRLRSCDPCTSFCFIRFEPVTFKIMTEAKLRILKFGVFISFKYRNSEQNAA